MNISTIMVDEISVMWGRSGNKITDVLIATASSGGELTGQQRRGKGGLYIFISYHLSDMLNLNVFYYLYVVNTVVSEYISGIHAFMLFCCYAVIYLLLFCCADRLQL